MYSGNILQIEYSRIHSPVTDRFLQVLTRTAHVLRVPSQQDTPLAERPAWLQKCVVNVPNKGTREKVAPFPARNVTEDINEIQGKSEKKKKAKRLYFQDKIEEKNRSEAHANDLKHLSIAEVRNDVSLDGWVRAEENHNREFR